MSGTAITCSSATAGACFAPTSSTAAATRRWGPPGATSMRRRSAARRSGRNHPRAIPRRRRTSGGTGTTTTTRRLRLTRSGSRCPTLEKPPSESATQRTQSLCSEGENDGTGQGKRGLLAVTRGCADIRNHGVRNGRFQRWPAGHVLRGRATRVTAERNGLHVLADERLPFSAVAEADIRLARRPQVPIRSSHSERATAVISGPSQSPDTRCTVRYHQRGEKNDDPHDWNT